MVVCTNGVDETGVNTVTGVSRVVLVVDEVVDNVGVRRNDVVELVIGMTVVVGVNLVAVEGIEDVGVCLVDVSSVGVIELIGFGGVAVEVVVVVVVVGVIRN
jgi:hypothetical protein